MRYTYTNNALRADQLDKRVADGALGVTLAISLDVAEVTHMTGLVRRGTVGLAVGVDCALVSSASITIGHQSCDLNKGSQPRKPGVDSQ